MFCSECGTKLKDIAKFCFACGLKVDVDADADDGTSKASSKDTDYDTASQQMDIAARETSYDIDISDYIEEVKLKGVSYDLNLSHKYLDGEIDENNFDKAVIIYTKLAEQGDKSATLCLGILNSIGIDGKENYKEAVKWFHNIELDHDIIYTEECYHLLAAVEEYWDEAVRRISEVAEQGDAASQYCLGQIYYRGLNDEQDYEIAFSWFKKSAEQGLAEAQYALGFIYCFGEGHDEVENFEKESVEWYKKAAEQGFVDAQYALGNIFTDEFDHGWIDESDYDDEEDYDEYRTRKYNEEAVKWYRKAAEQGHKGAIDELEKMSAINYDDNDDESENENISKILEILEAGKVEFPSLVQDNKDLCDEWETSRKGDDYAEQYRCTKELLANWEAQKWFAVSFLEMHDKMSDEIPDEVRDIIDSFADAYSGIVDVCDRNIIKYKKVLEATQEILKSQKQWNKDAEAREEFWSNIKGGNILKAFKDLGIYALRETIENDL